MHLAIFVEWDETEITLVLNWCKLIHFHWNMCIFVSSDFDLWRFDLKITSPFTYIKCNFPSTHKIRAFYDVPILSERKDIWGTWQIGRHKETDNYHKNDALSIVNIYYDVRRINRRPLLSLFAVNRSTWRKYMQKMIFTLSFPVTVTSNLVPQITLVLGHNLHQIWSFFTAFPFRVNRKHGIDRQTDRETDGVQHLTLPPSLAAHLLVVDHVAPMPVKRLTACAII